MPDAAPYASKHVLDLQNVQVLDATPDTPQLRPSRDDDGVHVAAYFGDTTANGLYSGSDVTLLQRVVVGSATGFAGYQLADPALIADINRSGTINGSDTTFVQRIVVGTPVSFVPPLPSGLPAAAGGRAGPAGVDPDRPAGRRGPDGHGAGEPDGDGAGGDHAQQRGPGGRV